MGCSSSSHKIRLNQNGDSNNNCNKDNRKLCQVNSITLPLSMDTFLALPHALLSEILILLPVPSLVNLEIAFGAQLDTALAWKQLCQKQGLTSRMSFLSSGSIVVTNRPSPFKLSWKKLFILNHQTKNPKKYLTYKDAKNRKYVVFVNEPGK